MSKNKSVAIRENENALTTPDYLKTYDGNLGTEDMGSDDLTVPRLKLAQALSPEVQDGDLKAGNIFLSLTGQRLDNEGVLRIVPIAYTKEYILWRPRQDNGGGILARARRVDTPSGIRFGWDQPNCKFEVKVGGNIPVIWETKEYIDQDGLDRWGSEIPGDSTSGMAATVHHNYVVSLPDHDNIVAALSMARSQTKRAKDFNGILKLGNAPMFARVFDIRVIDEQSKKKNNAKYKNLQIVPAGFVPEESFSFFKSLAETFASRSYVIHQDVDEEEATDDGAI